MKRSSQVGLLLMGTVAVGGGAYALMPSEHCQPNGMTQYGTQSAQCSPRSSSSSSYGGYRGSSSGYGFSSNTSSSQPSSGSSYGDHGSSGVARGGFGSFASHFTGGG